MLFITKVLVKIILLTIYGLTHYVPSKLTLGIHYYMTIRKV